MMKLPQSVPHLAVSASVVAVLIALATGLARAAPITVATPKLVTNTTGGKNQNPSIDKSGKLIVFTSNVNDLGAATFDFDGAGNGFSPSPACVNCSNADGNGELYLWRLKKSKGGDPANSFRQLTNTAGSGFDANQLPDMNQKGKVVAWGSDRDHAPGSPGNADGNREIFLIELDSGAITQVTDSAGGGAAANGRVNLSDKGNVLVFDSNRDYAGVLGCTLPDQVTGCDNSDNNAEIMLLDRDGNKLTQITETTGGGNSANIRPRVSNDGRFVAFQSRTNFAVLPDGSGCGLLSGGGSCGNSDGNGEIMMFDHKDNVFTQITKTTSDGSCSGANPNERVEISKKGKFITWQSKCEQKLNPAGCGSCDGTDNDEAFLADTKKGTILQLTVSKSGFNRVPRTSGSGRYMIFESNRNYKGLNSSHRRTLYVLKKNTKPGSGNQTGRGQVVEDPDSPLVQNPKAQLVTISFAGGFNSTIEQFGATTNGRRFAFDNRKGVKNQEIWFLDRKR